MRIEKIASSTDKQWNGQAIPKFANFFNFDSFPNSKNSENLLIFQFRKFLKFPI